VKSPAAQIVAIFKRGVDSLKEGGKKALNLSIRSMVLVYVGRWRQFWKIINNRIGQLGKRCNPI